MEKRDFALQMAVLEEVFEKQMSTQKAQIYYRLLKDYSAEHLEKAIAELLKTKRITTFPLPGEIIEAIEGTQTDRELIAWQMFLDGLEDPGTGYTVIFADKVIHSVANAMGGWQFLIGVDMDEWKKKEFCEYYRLYKKRNDHPKELIGRFEAENKGKGLLEHIPEKVFIGYKEKRLLPNPRKELPSAEEEPIDKSKVRSFIDKLDKEIEEEKHQKVKEIIKDRRVV